MPELFETTFDAYIDFIKNKYNEEVIDLKNIKKELLEFYEKRIADAFATMDFSIRQEEFKKIFQLKLMSENKGHKTASNILIFGEELKINVALARVCMMNTK